MPEAKFPPLPPIPGPGDYLARRREMQGLTIVDLAEQLAALPMLIITPRIEDVARLVDRLNEVEANGAPLSQAQASLASIVLRFDVDVYLKLVDLAAAGPDCGLPIPRICAGCGCTWHDACDPPCSWSAEDPQRCTVCTGADERAAERELAS